MHISTLVVPASPSRTQVHSPQCLTRTHSLAHTASASPSCTQAHSPQCLTCTHNLAHTAPALPLHNHTHSPQCLTRTHSLAHIAPASPSRTYTHSPKLQVVGMPWEPPKPLLGPRGLPQPLLYAHLRPRRPSLILAHPSSQLPMPHSHAQPSPHCPCLAPMHPHTQPPMPQLYAQPCPHCPCLAPAHLHSQLKNASAGHALGALEPPLGPERPPAASLISRSLPSSSQPRPRSPTLKAPYCLPCMYNLGPKKLHSRHRLCSQPSHGCIPESRKYCPLLLLEEKCRLWKPLNLIPSPKGSPQPIRPAHKVSVRPKASLTKTPKPHIAW